MTPAASYALGFGASLAVTALAAAWTIGEPVPERHRHRRQVEWAGTFIVFGLTLAAMTEPRSCRR